MADNAQLIAQCEARAKEWLSPAFDEETRKEVQAMLDNASLVQVAFVVLWVLVPTA